MLRLRPARRAGSRRARSLEAIGCALRDRPTAETLDGSRTNSNDAADGLEVFKGLQAARSHDRGSPAGSDSGQTLEGRGLGNVEIQRQPEKQSSRPSQIRPPRGRPRTLDLHTAAALRARFHGKSAIHAARRLQIRAPTEYESQHEYDQRHSECGIRSSAHTHTPLGATP
jgi:hypothetical protein